MSKAKQFNRKSLRYIGFIKRNFYPFLLILEFFHIRKFFAGGIDRLIKKIGIEKSQEIFFKNKVFSFIFKNAFLKVPKSTRFDLVFPSMLGANSNFTFLNLLLAKEALNRGMNPCFLVCDAAVPICSKERIEKTRKNNRFFCHECHTGYREIQTKTGISVLKFSDFLNNSRDIEIIQNEKERILRFITIDDCLGYEMGDLPVGAIVHKSVLRFYLAGELENTSEVINVYKKFLEAAVIEIIVINNFLNNQKEIRKASFNNGTVQFEKIFSLLAAGANIDFITYENFVGKNSVIFKKNDEVMNLNWDAELNKFYQRNKWTPEFESAVNNHFREIQQGKGMYAVLNEKHDEARFSNIQNYAVLFTNLNFDTAVIGKKTFFDSMRNWIDEVIDYWENQKIQMHLIIRVHPGEIKLKTASSEFMGDYIRNKIKSDKIILVDSDQAVNSYELINNMKFALIYSSTIGIEIAWRGKPCLVAGKPFFLGKSFVISPETKKDYFTKLDALISGEIFIPDRHELLKLVYHMYFVRNRKLKGIRIRTPKGEAVVDTMDLNKILSQNKDFLTFFFNELTSGDS